MALWLDVGSAAVACHAMWILLEIQTMASSSFVQNPSGLSRAHPGGKSRSSALLHPATQMDHHPGVYKRF